MIQKLAVQRRIPILVFFTIYFLTGYIGAMIMMFGPQSFWDWYVYFSGVTMPTLYYDELFRMMVLFHIPPAVMWIGYEIYIYIKYRKSEDGQATRISDIRLSSKFTLALFLISLLLSVVSIIRSGVALSISNWLDYNAFIQARYKLFETLNFFEFVNIYTILPVAASLLIIYIVESKPLFKRMLYSLLIIISIVCVNIFIYQKKPLMTGLTIIVATLIIYFFGGQKPKLKISVKWMRSITGAVISMYVIYLALIIAPVISESSSAYIPSEAVVAAHEQNNSNGAATGGQTEEKKIRKIFKEFSEQEVENTSRVKNLILYATMAPLNRTSPQMIVYPTIFPDLHAYYPVDLGQDIIGRGSMPDDNTVVWDALNPTQPGGSVAAPFHFVLYSQGGLSVAIIGSFLIGFLLSVGWQYVIGRNESASLQSALGGIIILFAVYIALDSARNSMTVSYGLMWPAGVIFGIIIGFNCIQKLKRINKSQ
ncbi:hypothetical protein [Cohnella boryungensis]|uniref:Oligosaccharide repeat unit polymerase n=1 Tax=Cohnella boryungensis TaxID=768479 RepID=A0ABV8S7E5_9BACL